MELDVIEVRSPHTPHSPSLISQNRAFREEKVVMSLKPGLDVNYTVDLKIRTGFLPWDPMKEVRFWETFQNGWEIEGIKSVRTQTGLGLREAKDL